MLFIQEFSFLPIEGGLSGEPSALPLVDQFLENESHCNAVTQLINKRRKPRTIDTEYQSLIDQLLVELKPHFAKLCTRFYYENGKPLRDLRRPRQLRAMDIELRGKLDMLVSEDWPFWEDFMEAQEKWVLP